MRDSRLVLRQQRNTVLQAELARVDLFGTTTGLASDHESHILTPHFRFVPLQFARDNCCWRVRAVVLFAVPKYVRFSPHAVAAALVVSFGIKGLPEYSSRYS